MGIENLYREVMDLKNMDDNEQKEAVPKTLSGRIRRVELREQEIDRQKAAESGPKQEYFYWNFPELKSKK